MWIQQGDHCTKVDPMQEGVTPMGAIVIHVAVTGHLDPYSKKGMGLLCILPYGTGSKCKKGV